MALRKKTKQEIIKKFSIEKNDTGSPEVQVAILSKVIEKLQNHLAENKHDAPAKRGLLTKISKRRRLLRYLVARDKKRYQKLIKTLGLKK